MQPPSFVSHICRNPNYRETYILLCLTLSNSSTRTTFYLDVSRIHVTTMEILSRALAVVNGAGDCGPNCTRRRNLFDTFVVNCHGRLCIRGAGILKRVDLC